MPGGRFHTVDAAALTREEVGLLNRGLLPPKFGDLLLHALTNQAQKEAFPSTAGSSAPLALSSDIKPAPSPGATTRLALVFDDGYQSNMAAAAVLARYGFAATLAVEIEKIATNYGSDPLFPVCTADDLRSLIEDYNWEIANHPNLDTDGTEEEMVEAAQAEHSQLRNILTGALVRRDGEWVVAAAEHPEYSDYPVLAAVYRGGSRNATSDTAFSYLFDKIRTIPGTLEARGNRLHLTSPEGEFSQHWSAYSIDTDGDASELRQAIAFIQGASSAGLYGVLYAHKTPATAASADAASPYLDLEHLEEICKAARDAGVVLCPLRDLGTANVCLDPRFEDENSHTFTVASGDTAEYSDESTLHGAARAAKLVWTSYRSTIASTSLTTDTFPIRPFTRYTVTIRYRFPEDIVRELDQPNHGLAVQWLTYQGNTAGEQGGHIDDYTHLRNFGSPTRPYQSNDGAWQTFEVELYSGWGYQAAIKVGGYKCTGTAYIGHIAITRGESLLRSPMKGASTHNGAGSRNIYLMRPNSDADARVWEWEFRIMHENNPTMAGIPTLTNSSTYTQAAVTNVGGSRVDAFSWVAAPVWVG